MLNLKRSVLFLLMSLNLASCSYVALHPGAPAMLYSNHEPECRLLHEQEFQTRHQFLWWNRDPQTVAEELEILARNKAQEINANALWPETAVTEGRQRFSLFRCARFSP